MTTLVASALPVASAISSWYGMASAVDPTNSIIYMSGGYLSIQSLNVYYYLTLLRRLYLECSLEVRRRWRSMEPAESYPFSEVRALYGMGSHRKPSDNSWGQQR